MGSERPYPDFSSTSYGRTMRGQSSAEPCRTVPNKVRQQCTATKYGNKVRQQRKAKTYGKNARPTCDVNISETVCLIYIKISQILNIDVDRKRLKFQVNQTTRFPDIDVGSWTCVFAVSFCLTLLPYFVAVLCCRTLLPYFVWHGTAEL